MTRVKGDTFYRLQVMMTPEGIGCHLEVATYNEIHMEDFMYVRREPSTQSMVDLIEETHAWRVP